MNPKPWRPDVPDHQMIAEAQLENTMRDIVEWRTIPGTTSEVGLDKLGKVLVRGCRGPRVDNPVLSAQELLAYESQVVGADDDWA